MAANTREALLPRRATYQDVLDAPEHQVAEIVDGTLHTHPRPAVRHARASSSLGGRIGGPFDYDADGPGGGGFSTNRSCISARTSSFRTSRAGGGSGCPSCPTPRTSPSPRTGFARCCRLRRAGSICTASARSTRAKGSCTCGSSTRRTGRSRRSSFATASGCSSRRQRTTSRSASAHSTRSRSAWGCSGHERLAGRRAGRVDAAVARPGGERNSSLHQEWSRGFLHGWIPDCR